MKIGVPKQNRVGEDRVPLVPTVVKRLVAAGHEVRVQSEAGMAAHASDQAYAEAGATVVMYTDEPPVEIWSEADVVVTIEPPDYREIEAMTRGSVLVGMLEPGRDPALIETIHRAGVTAFSLEKLPRTTRAQAMDVLSSQASLAGYKAAVLAADYCPKMFPMMMTAAGTLAPAKVFVLGAGVAGLQAVATAKRLGGTVTASDVRAAVKEQVQSLGGRFVQFGDGDQSDAATGGYAKEQSEEDRRKQVEGLTNHVANQDAVIATAAIPGKAPPMLLPAAMVAGMAPGSVVVDLAASEDHGRGNCELTQPGKVIVTDHGVTIVGLTNLAATLPVHASQAYSNNIAAFLGLLTGEGGALAMNMEDELLAACRVLAVDS